MSKSKWLIEREFNAAVESWQKSVAHMGKALADAAFIMNQQADLIQQLVVEKAELIEQAMLTIAEQNTNRKAE